MQKEAKKKNPKLKKKKRLKLTTTKAKASKQSYQCISKVEEIKIFCKPFQFHGVGYHDDQEDWFPENSVHT